MLELKLEPILLELVLEPMLRELAVSAPAPWLLVKLIKDVVHFVFAPWFA